jgi:hypothetical protein
MDAIVLDNIQAVIWDYDYDYDYDYEISHSLARPASSYWSKKAGIAMRNQRFCFGLRKVVRILRLCRAGARRSQGALSPGVAGPCARLTITDHDSTHPASRIPYPAPPHPVPPRHRCPLSIAIPIPIPIWISTCGASLFRCSAAEPEGLAQVQAFTLHIQEHAILGMPEIVAFHRIGAGEQQRHRRLRLRWRQKFYENI